MAEAYSPGKRAPLLPTVSIDIHDKTTAQRLGLGHPIIRCWLCQALARHTVPGPSSGLGRVQAGYILHDLITSAISLRHFRSAGGGALGGRAAGLSWSVGRSGKTHLCGAAVPGCRQSSRHSRLDGIPSMDPDPGMPRRFARNFGVCQDIVGVACSRQRLKAEVARDQVRECGIRSIAIPNSAQPRIHQTDQPVLRPEAWRTKCIVLPMYAAGQSFARPVAQWGPFRSVFGPTHGYGASVLHGRDGRDRWDDNGAVDLASRHGCPR